MTKRKNQSNKSIDKSDKSIDKSDKVEEVIAEKVTTAKTNNQTKNSSPTSQKKKDSSGNMIKITSFIGLIALAGGAYFITQPRTLQSFQFSESTKPKIKNTKRKLKETAQPIKKTSTKSLNLTTETIKPKISPIKEITKTTTDDNIKTEPSSETNNIPKILSPNIQNIPNIIDDKIPTKNIESKTKPKAEATKVIETTGTETTGTEEIIENLETSKNDISSATSTTIENHPITNPTKLNILQNEINRLTERNKELEELLNKQHKISNSSQINLDFMILEKHIRNGNDFTNELKTLLNNPNTPVNIHKALQPLKTTKNITFVNNKELQKQFKTSLHNYLKRNPALTTNNSTNGKPKDISLWDRTIGNISSLVTIRKVGKNIKGDDDQSIIARMEANINNGEYSKAQIEQQDLSDEAMPFFKNLSKPIKQRLLIEKALSEARSALPETNKN